MSIANVKRSFDSAGSAPTSTKMTINESYVTNDIGSNWLRRNDIALTVFIW